MADLDPLNPDRRPSRPDPGRADLPGPRRRRSKPGPAEQTDPVTPYDEIWFTGRPVES